MNVNQLLLKEVETRIIECGIYRIISCIEKLEEEQIHFRPNDNSNSINNQILHLDGNVRQWLISTMSATVDSRQRNNEFDSENRNSKTDLIARMHQLEKDIRNILVNIESIDLTKTQTVQCYVESNLSIIVHVIEHFSYHVGQITYITKMLLDIDTGYYAGQELDKTS
ncbi:MAG: putative damage-inducible protein DinB [Saprospiraceae bacterium]|jgi:uncharacterized damage-inducible protein DinB